MDRSVNWSIKHKLYEKDRTIEKRRDDKLLNALI